MTRREYLAYLTAAWTIAALAGLAGLAATAIRPFNGAPTWVSWLLDTAIASLPLTIGVIAADRWIRRHPDDWSE